MPITWINKEIYSSQLKNTKANHKFDKLLEDLARTLNLGVLSADKDFKDRPNINKLLEKSEKSG